MVKGLLLNVLGAAAGAGKKLIHKHTFKLDYMYFKDQKNVYRPVLLCRCGEIRPYKMGRKAKRFYEIRK